jgi:hypothetical protein
MHGTATCITRRTTSSHTHAHTNTHSDEDVEEDDEGEELIGDQMEDDYRAIPELDVYDPAMLADENEEVDELDAGERARVERELRKRDLAEARGRTQGIDMDNFLFIYCAALLHMPSSPSTTHPRAPTSFLRLLSMDSNSVFL